MTLQLSREFLSNKKICVVGLPEQGKTYLVALIAGLFKCLVYTSHFNKEDRDYETWDNLENAYVIIPKDFISEFTLWCGAAKRMAKTNTINCFIIDDADLLFKSHFDTNRQFQSLIINCAHYGLTLIFVSRRPQDLPTKVFEQSEIICAFPIEGTNVIKKFNVIHEGFGDMVKNLTYDSHDFVLKIIGQAPIVQRV